MMDQCDILNAIECQIHEDRGTIYAEMYVDRLRNIIKRYEAGFYNQDHPWGNDDELQEMDNLPSQGTDNGPDHVADGAQHEEDGRCGLS